MAMSVTVAPKPKPPFNGAVLRWARERASLSLDEAARKIAKAPDDIEAWEEESRVPTVRQARLLADAYGRPFLEFFLDEPPKLPEPTLIPDLRMHRDASPVERRELLAIQTWAEEQRLNALDLYETLGESPPNVPEGLVATTNKPAEAFASIAREAIDFPIELQLALTSSQKDTLPRLLRRRFEASGILVLKDNSLAKHRARGMCVAHFPLPIIVFGGEAASAQAFTLAHELGHVALRQSAISGAPWPQHIASSARAVEDWCDRFAAAFLIPAKSLAAFREKPSTPASRIDDLELRTLARTFGVSPHATLLRLVNLGYVNADFYWNVKREHFLEEERDYRPPPARSEYYGSRYRNSCGDLYTSLVLEAWSTGLITNHNAGEFMGIKNLAHLDDIRDRFVAR